MKDLSHIHLHQDDQLLVDYLTGQIDEELKTSVARRLTEDSEFAARAAKLNQLFMVLDACPAESPSELVISRTLAAVGSTPAIRKPVFRASGMLPFGMREFVAVAALFLIVAAIIMPVVTHSHRLYRQQICSSRTGGIGQALNQFAAANNGQLPATADMNAGWLNGSSGERVVSNSSNLWKLVENEYIDANAFHCPSVESPDSIKASDAVRLTDFPSGVHVDYSYQNAVNAEAIRVDLAKNTSQMAILADRSPIFYDGAFDSGRLSAVNSPNHGHRGQSVLYLDMHSEWFTSSDVGVNGDNIWLARDVFNYSGNERPADSNDTFLLPAFIKAP